MLFLINCHPLLLFNQQKHLCNLPWLLLSILFLWSSVSTAKEIIACFEHTPKPPFYLGHHTLAEPPGVAVELLNKLLERLSLKPIYKRMPWWHCLARLEQGRCDLVFPVQFKYSRKTYGVFPLVAPMVHPTSDLALIQNTHYLFTTKRLSFEWDSKGFKANTLQLDGAAVIPADLTIAVPILYPNISHAKSLQTHLKMLHSTKDCLDHLVVGDIHGAILLGDIADHYLSQSEYQGVDKHPIAFSERPGYLLWSHAFVEKNPDILTSVLTELPAVTAEHSAAIYQKYLDY